MVLKLFPRTIQNKSNLLLLKIAVTIIVAFSDAKPLDTINLNNYSFEPEEAKIFLAASNSSTTIVTEFASLVSYYTKIAALSRNCLKAQYFCCSNI